MSFIKEQQEEFRKRFIGLRVFKFGEEEEAVDFISQVVQNTESKVSEIAETVIRDLTYEYGVKAEDNKKMQMYLGIFREKVQSLLKEITSNTKEE